jgi:hypothetical protein
VEKGKKLGTYAIKGGSRFEKASRTVGFTFLCNHVWKKKRSRSFTLQGEKEKRLAHGDGKEEQ